MYMFTQCSRQLGYFFLSGTNQRKKSTNSSNSTSPLPFLFPHLVKLFHCGRSLSSKLILLHVGVQSSLKLMHKLIFTMLPLSSSKSPLAWMTVWQMRGIRSISFNRCSGGDRSGCVGQSVSASSSAFMPSLSQRLFQKDPGAGDSWTDWDASCLTRAWGSLQQKLSTNLREYDNHRGVEGCYETIQEGDHFGSYLQNAYFLIKIFDRSVILLQVFAGSRDASFITQVTLFTIAKYWPHSLTHCKESY